MTKVGTISRLRNIGIIAHIDAGKTTCTERVLFYTGKIHRIKEVHDGDAEMDFLDEEKRRGITISSACTTVHWAPLSGMFREQKHTIQIVDTPGHVDFTIEVERSLGVLDGAVTLLDASQGVEPQSETVWRQADRYGIARILFVNKMDKVGADFAMCLTSIRNRLGVKPVPVQWPLGEEQSFRGVIDLIAQRALVYSKEAGVAPSIEVIPEELQKEVQIARHNLIEACSEIDDSVLSWFVEKGPEQMPNDLVENALRKATLSGAFVPVFCGSAYDNTGVEPLLDAIINYLPAPEDKPALQGVNQDGEAIERRRQETEMFCGQVFKVVSDKNAGMVTWLRVYSGALTQGQSVLNSSRDKVERIGRIMVMHAQQKYEIATATAGAIVAVTGLKSVRTGDTLCDRMNPIVLGAFVVPEPVLSVAIEPVSRIDQDRLAGALYKSALEDPSLKVSTDVDSGQTLLSGMGELHLDIVVSRLRSEHNVTVRTGKPKVAYREAISRESSAEIKYAKQNGGVGQFAHVVVRIEPLERGKGFVFRDQTKGGVIPKEFTPSVEKGARNALERGVLGGYPVVDVAVTLLDGSTHSKDSDSLSFEIAASMAVQQAAKNALPFFLEPRMCLEIVTPEESVGAIVGDLGARRGEVRSITDRGVVHLVEAIAPLAELFGYEGNLRGISHGRASSTMRQWDLYPVPEKMVPQLKIQS